MNINILTESMSYVLIFLFFEFTPLYRHYPQKCTKALLEKGLINEDEFNKITALNRESFSPYLVELMS